MSAPIISLQLVRPPRRACEFCGGTMTAIELWHGCPERRLALGLYQLRQSRLKRTAPA